MVYGFYIMQLLYIIHIIYYNILYIQGGLETILVFSNNLKNSKPYKFFLPMFISKPNSEFISK